ncbi:MAG: hypothetical protein JOY90_21540 [Bradyrhizobium sp.]|uniref:hypothetical protein n=1 Tax=Bradyrhizobium sp. TaxID=376 RepID=UPI001D2AFA8D|nr:hypothetical protein [Bradyrhizobium sp.]MBV9563000.1 hypothetical protein [Bradyrhizobium sp.]
MTCEMLRRGARLSLFGLALTCAPSLAQAAPPVPAEASTKPIGTCTICAMLSLADDVIFAPPPLLRLPEAVEFLYRTTGAEFVHLRSTGSAPPHVAQHNS